MRKESLAERITSVLVTTPAQVDIEDDFDDNSLSVLKTNTEDAETVEESTFRKKNVNLLADIDSRYGGTIESRKSLNYQESDLEEFENNTESESVTSNEGTHGLQKDYDSDQDSEDNSSDNLQEEYESDEDRESIDNSHTDDKFKSTNHEDVMKSFKKGQCVKNQMTLWEYILEMRIQMQKSLMAANKMPQCEYYRNMKNTFGQDFTNSVKDTKKSLSTLLNKLLLLQKLLWDRCPEIKKIQKPDNNPDDEEIPSDSDEDENEDEIKNSTPSKKRKLSDFERDLKEKNDTFKNYRDHVIKKWHEKIRITSTNNDTNVLPIISHIEHVLTNKDKLIRKTQLRRTTYKIVGENIENDTDKNNLEGSVAIYNKEIFDDDDFYHQLLRELIEFKSADLTDPVQLSRRWMQLQSLRNKMKRKIDTKATKGRKIRYDVHKKLVHFVSPIVDNLWSDEAKMELFSSLFGKTNI
ncbi:protein AATF [Diorhabda carinulata]|uniref:protein AATF n=1 Tax=Diorhabda carinulata TaxID=1163345 RepID=UPI0025A2F70C|nr:protein AATF [Diorhabda carinulata]